MSKQQPQGISPDQLFQQFTKANSVVQNSFQLLFEGANEIQVILGKLSKENELMKQILKEKGIEFDFEPEVSTSPTIEGKPPNRKERRANEKKTKKK